MPSTVYSTRFLLAQGLTTSQWFTCDDGFIIVVRDISGYFGSQGTAPSVAVDINGAKFFEADTTPLGLGPFHWEGRQVLNAGDRCTAQMLNGNCDILISGYLLTAP